VRDGQLEPLRLQAGLCPLGAATPRAATANLKPQVDTSVTLRQTRAVAAY